MKTSPAAAFDPARRLIFSRTWSQQAVIFDARSGDFWVVDGDVRDALSSANSDAALAAEHMQGLGLQVIENLIAHGIIQASKTS